MSLRGMPKNVLIVEADPDRCHRLAVLTNRFGYNVFSASNGPGFLRMVNGVIPNVVLINLRLPLVDGKSYLEMLRGNEFLKVVKAVTYSDKADSGILKESLEKGADACTVMPVNPTALFEIFERLTETKPRKVPRLRVIFKVHLSMGKEEGTAYATSISEAGLFIRTGKPLEVKTKVKLSVELPSEKTPLDFDGQVIYARQHNPEKPLEPGMGILFAGMSEDKRLRMRKFVESLISAEISPDMLI